MTYPAGPTTTPPSLRKGFAIASLVIGIVAILGCLIPFLNIGSIILALVGLTLGILSLVQRRDGRGMAVAGVVLAGLTIVVSVVVNVAAGALLSDSSDTPSPTAAVEEGTGVKPAPEPGTSEEATTEALAPGTSAVMGDYTVTVTSVLANANELVEGANSFNGPPEGQYVVAELTVTNNGQEEGTPWIDVTPTFLGTDALNYSTTSCSAILPNPSYDQPSLRPTGTVSYQVCFDVPPTAIEGGQIGVEQFANFQDDEVLWRIS